ncbi:hypothetical protein HDE_10064 [Halotydeus destructor]|nr:hypothetical protein HDE_10064 [Halotydeus destructor]
MKLVIVLSVCFAVALGVPLEQQHVQEEDNQLQLKHDYQQKELVQEKFEIPQQELEPSQEKVQLQESAETQENTSFEQGRTSFDQKSEDSSEESDSDQQQQVQHSTNLFSPALPARHGVKGGLKIKSNKSPMAKGRKAFY